MATPTFWEGIGRPAGPRGFVMAPLVVPAPGHPPAPPTPAEPLPGGGPRRRRRAPRIVGIDVARAGALFGMLTAHLGTGHVDGGQGSQWMWIADGRSSALFATLSGVSLSLVTRHVASDDRAGRAAARTALVVRAAAIALVGYLLVLLDTPIAIILPTYAALFLLAVPLLWVRSRTLLALAVAVVGVAAPAVLWLRHTLTGRTGSAARWATSPVLGELVTGYYPALIWIAYVLTGILVARWALTRTAGQVALAGIGIGLAVLGYGIGHLLTAGRNPGRSDWSLVLVSISPHSGSSFETVGNIGVALTVIAFFLLVCRLTAAATLLGPLGFAGGMPLTLYTAQIIVIALLGTRVVWLPSSNLPLVILAVASLIFATTWGTVFGRGPLEAGLHHLSTAVSRAVVGRGSVPKATL